MSEMKSLTLKGKTYDSFVDKEARESIKNLSPGGNATPGENGGYYTPKVEQTDANTMKVSYTASKSGMPSIAEQSITLPAGPKYELTEIDKQEIAERAAELVEVSGGGGASVYIGPDKPTGENLPLYWLDTSVDEPVTPEEPDVPDVPDIPDEPDEPEQPEKTLTSISATYSGGDVAVGTAVTALTGIVVTAHYSDGSTATVTGYTLSGTIAEGSNTITVSYGGKTTTFTVTGVAESGGEEPEDEWETVNVTNGGSGNLTWYSDDGATELAKATKSRSYTGVFDVDTEVKVALVLNNTQYSALYVGMMNAGNNLQFYYAEKFGSYYPYETGKTYERTFTVKAGYALAVGGWAGANNIESLTVWKKV